MSFMKLGHKFEDLQNLFVQILWKDTAVGDIRWILSGLLRLLYLQLTKHLITLNVYIKQDL